VNNGRTYAYGEQLKKNDVVPPWKAAYTQTAAYHIWLGTNEKEFYDLTTDPFELNGTISASEQPLVDAYKQAISEYAGCAGASCRSAGMGP
jgi:hypothetical protein